MLNVKYFNNIQSMFKTKTFFVGFFFNRSISEHSFHYRIPAFQFYLFKISYFDLLKPKK